MNKCLVCGRSYTYNGEKGYDRELCGPYCDGKKAVLKVVEELIDLRDEFEGPSLDYMQGYRDGQSFLQNELRVILHRFHPTETKFHERPGE